MTDYADTLNRPLADIFVFDGVKLLDFVDPAGVIHEA